MLKLSLKTLAILLLALSITGLTIGCEPSKKDVEKQLQKEGEEAIAEALKDTSKAEKSQGKPDYLYNLGETFTVNFRMREYEKQTTQHEGKAQIKVNHYRILDQAKNETPVNGAFLAVNITLVGSSENKGFPISFDQLGTDPSPQYYLVDAGGKKYKTNTWNTKTVNDTRPKSLGDINIKETTPKTLNIAFDVPKDIADPRLRIEWYNLQGAQKSAEIPLGKLKA